MAFAFDLQKCMQQLRCSNKKLFNEIEADGYYCSEGILLRKNDAILDEMVHLKLDGV